MVDAAQLPSVQAGKKLQHVPATQVTLETDWFAQVKHWLYSCFLKIQVKDFVTAI
jgi:hypothetical protein